MSEHGAVTVAEVQTPDLHVPVSRAGGDQRAVLVDRETRGVAVGYFVPFSKPAGKLDLIRLINWTTVIKTERKSQLMVPRLKHDHNTFQMHIFCFMLLKRP